MQYLVYSEKTTLKEPSPLDMIMEVEAHDFVLVV